MREWLLTKKNIKFMLVKQNIPYQRFPSFLRKKKNLEHFYPDKANSLGIPKGELWHKLQQGEEVVIENKSIKPSEVMGPKVPGKKNWYIW